MVDGVDHGRICGRDRFLAWLAYANGRKATKIAAEAPQREERHREREVDQREHEARSAVAMAMMRAVSATEQYTKARDTPVMVREQGHAILIREAASEMQRVRAEALSAVALYATEPEDDELHVWIDSALEQLASRPVRAIDRLTRVGAWYDTRRAIRIWNAREVTSGEIIAGKLPPEVVHYTDDETQVPSV